MMSQKEQIIRYMRLTGSITTKEAIDNIGCTRLSGRIWDLKHDGYNIKTERVKVPMRGGRHTYVMRYSLNE